MVRFLTNSFWQGLQDIYANFGKVEFFHWSWTPLTPQSFAWIPKADPVDFRTKKCSVDGCHPWRPTAMDMARMLRSPERIWHFFAWWTALTSTRFARSLAPRVIGGLLFWCWKLCKLSRGSSEFSEVKARATQIDIYRWCIIALLCATSDVTGMTRALQEQPVLALHLRLCRSAHRRYEVDRSWENQLRQPREVDRQVIRIDSYWFWHFHDISWILFMFIIYTLYFYMF